MSLALFYLLLVALLATLCIRLGAVDSPSLADASLQVFRALPASTSAVTSYAIDVGPVTPLGVRTSGLEFLLSAPAVTQAQLPDGKTFTYDIIHSDNSDLSSPSTLDGGIIVQTGSSGAAAATARRRLPSNAKRYIGVVITPSASGTGDASATTAMLQAFF